MENPPTVLVVDDNVLNLKIINDVLSEDYNVLTAKCGPEALQILASHPLPQLVLLDVVMPEISGFDVCKKIKATSEWKDIPVIFLTSLNSETDEAYGLELGAADYITIPFNPSLMKARVKNHICMKLYYDRLMKSSLVDGLTGLPNRKRFDETLDQEWRRSFRSGDPLSFIIVDIDHFKEYNDTYGHLAGDSCIKKVACQLNNTLRRPGDFLGRWGGDEFVALMPQTDATGAMLLAEKFRHKISILAIPHESSPIIPQITISLGVATMIPRGGECSEELVKRADEALFTAKKAGRNRIVQRLTGISSSIGTR